MLTGGKLERDIEEGSTVATYETTTRTTNNMAWVTCLPSCTSPLYSLCIYFIHLTLSPRSPCENFRLRLTPSVVGAVSSRCCRNIVQQQRMILTERRTLYPRNIPWILAGTILARKPRGALRTNKQSTPRPSANSGGLEAPSASLDGGWIFFARDRIERSPAEHLCAPRHPG